MSLTQINILVLSVQTDVYCKKNFFCLLNMLQSLFVTYICFFLFEGKFNFLIEYVYTLGDLCANSTPPYNFLKVN